MPAVPEERSDLLRECTPPVLASVTLDAGERARIPGCVKQLDQAFATFFRATAKSETDVLVCHGNVIRYLVMKALGADPRLWTNKSVGHASLTEIQVRADGSMRVLIIGDVGHIAANLQSGTGGALPALTSGPH